jgi:hypothetical protein
LVGVWLIGLKSMDFSKTQMSIVESYRVFINVGIAIIFL